MNLLFQYGLLISPEEGIIETMNNDTWQKQSDKPLFPELEWNKPERRDQAGRLLIIGGSTHALGAPAIAYQQARQNGIGDVKVALPDKTRKLIDKRAVDAVFTKSTPSGEFALDGTTVLIEYALWADSLLLSGDVGRNSQTSIALEELLRSFSETIVITNDAIESLSNAVKQLFERQKTTLVLRFGQLQKLLQLYRYPSSLHSDMGLVQLVEFLQKLTKTIGASIVTLHNSQYVVATNGKVVTTKMDLDKSDSWQLKTAVKTVCYQTWNPEKQLESLTQSVYENNKNVFL